MAAQPDSKRKPMLGCVADDVTGATDLAINLVHGGMSVVQVMGVPTAEDLRRLDTDAIVVALKTRSIASSDAISQSVASLDALRAIGVERFFFKYCSTFDSTEKGNIGPVAEAMMEALDVAQTIFCPALPRNGRTVYAGHLFVKGRLLNESGMENHPLNPMTDPDLVRFLGKQAVGQTGLLSYEAFSDGSEGVRRRLRGERFRLDASGTTDPDGDSLVYLWIQYTEAGSARRSRSTSATARRTCILFHGSRLRSRNPRLCISS